MLDSMIHNISFTLDQVQATFQRMKTSSWGTLGKCQRNLKSCPPGHEVKACDNTDEFQCKQCGTLFFQPNENRLGDKCRWRKLCTKAFMKYVDYGSTVKDAKCACEAGYHFENEDQRACVPNRKCEKGLGQGQYGVCENCLEKMMYSDTNDRIQACKPLRNCEKENRCTTKKSNGTFDNICGPKVRDVNDCSSIVGDGGDYTTIITVAVVGGILGALLIFLLILCLYRRRQTKRNRHETPLTEEQLEELKDHIIHRCEKDEDLCTKVLCTSFTQIESRIGRQSWGLAQGLFRAHPMTGKYEILVETYRDKSQKEIVKGYLSEWRSWRGDTHTAVKELFDSLRHCKRDDIVYEICNRLRYSVGDISLDLEGNSDDTHPNNRAQKNVFCNSCYIFPCIKKTETPEIKKGESLETTNKLLEVKSMEPQTAGTVYRQASYPSAPVLEDSNGLLSESEVQFHRQYSQPVQATS